MTMVFEMKSSLKYLHVSIRNRIIACFLFSGKFLLPVLYSPGIVTVLLKFAVFDVTMCQSNYTQVDSMKLCQ